MAGVRPSQTGSCVAEVLSSAMPGTHQGAKHNPKANCALQAILCIQAGSFTYRERKSLTAIHR